MKKKPLLKCIDCAYLPVTNVAKSVAWYEQVLGLTQRQPIRSPEKGAIMLMGSGQWLFLLPTPLPQFGQHKKTPPR